MRVLIGDPLAGGDKVGGQAQGGRSKIGAAQPKWTFWRAENAPDPSPPSPGPR